MRSHVDPATSVGFALKRLQQTLRARMDAALAEHGLTSPLYAVLAVLAEEPGLSNAELARRSYVAAPTMLRMLDSLSRDGLVLRDDRSRERRSRGNTLTAEGRRRLTAASVPVQAFEELLVAQAAPEHVDVVMAWMHSCAERLDEQPDQVMVPGPS